ncbi:hypothetical protein PQR70_25525 [Paraburkholderia madseniana]|uniref:hypothetical protein n=1 Tax=Paraburkholderia madseniana TaxID=2599607 RepID=UPI0038B78C73
MSQKTVAGCVGQEKPGGNSEPFWWVFDDEAADFGGSWEQLKFALFISTLIARCNCKFRRKGGINFSQSNLLRRRNLLSDYFTRTYLRHGGQGIYIESKGKVFSKLIRDVVEFGLTVHDYFIAMVAETTLSLC